VTRHTKIVATLGPASDAPNVIDAMIQGGVDVFRLNFSHGSHESHAATFRAVRDATRRAGRHVAILQDLAGPKIRTTALEGGIPLALQDGETLRIAAGGGVGTRGLIYTPYAPLLSAAKPGDRLLIDDGHLELQVTGREDGALVTLVVHGGQLGEHKGINAPGVDLPAGSLTGKDEQDLRFGLELGVDLVALSFVQTPADIASARQVLASAGAAVPLVAKIERPQALAHLHDIVSLSDGVMVARGDLGLECPLEHLPRIQKQVIATARALGRPTILATQVLESMRTEPRPTRAEVSDAATAVDEGVDAIMLAGETAAGAYPVRAVEMLAAIIADAEVGPGSIRALRTGAAASDVTEVLLGSSHGLAMCEAAVTLVSSGQAEAIVAITRQGKTAQLLSALRPRAAVLAVTEDEAVARRLALCWGVTPVVSSAADSTALERALRAAFPLSAQPVVAFISLSPDLARRDANFLNVQQLGT
jgi:pyruvate kinase